jgi:Fe-Mn family superoxide dismutase
MNNDAKNRRVLCRRRFIKELGAASALGGVLNARLLGSDVKPFALAPLPYPYEALEPYINKATMQMHHDRICAVYVNNLNKLVAEHAPYLFRQKVEELLAVELYAIPEEIRDSVRENGGGVLNHTLFFDGMAPEAGGAPVGELAQAIPNTFGSFEKWKERFTAVALKQAGTAGGGWVWLVRDDVGKLEVTSTSNQDSATANMWVPLVALDVCEHAYKLQYHTHVADYVAAFYNVVNWSEANKRFTAHRED